MSFLTFFKWVPVHDHKKHNPELTRSRVDKIPNGHNPECLPFLMDTIPNWHLHLFSYLSDL